MSRIVVSIAAVALLVAGTAHAAGTTPPGPWLPVIKDVVREKLKNPVYVTFKRIFFVNKKTDDGALPVCGFVSFKQKKEEHPPTLPFFGLLTPPDNGKAGSFAGLKLGETDDLKKDIAETCKNYGVY
jgi:hypothetical protein